jgi:23S rRNA (uridine2552-2'-O)-methyltransferase
MVVTRVKSARGRSNSSTRWLQRQLNDPYVEQARREGYRARAVYKLLELQERFELIPKTGRIVDLGCAPGSWLQVAAKHTKGKAKIIGIDLLEIEPVSGTEFMQLDFTDNDAPDILKTALGGKANLVMSDMAANTTGHAATDHIRIMNLCEMAYEFAREVLAPGGHFICKVLKGGTEGKLLTQMKREFKTVKHAKPKSSRQDSAESYVVALGFRGLEEDNAGD